MYDPLGKTAIATPVECKFLDIIIFYSHPDSTLNMDDIVNNQSYSSNYIAWSVSSYEELIEALNKIPSRANNVFLYLHSEKNRESKESNKYCFTFYYAKYYFEDDISSTFPEINIHGNIYLFSCHGANLAQNIAKKTGQNVVATRQGVSFTRDGRARCGLFSIVESVNNCEIVGWFTYTPSGMEYENSGSIYAHIIH